MWLQDTLSRYWIARCAICGLERGEPSICRGCRSDFLERQDRRCKRCAIPLQAEHDLCGQCLRHPPHFDATVTLADYAPPLDGMILALKFGHRLELAPILGRLLGERARALAPLPTLLIAVPLSFERHAERGFNQSLEVGRAAARALGVACDPDALLRVRHAVAQASLRLEARRRNIHGAFAVRRPVRGSSLAVVDDVMTSGSTLDEVARVLKAAGAAHVINLVVARTP